MRARGAPAAGNPELIFQDVIGEKVAIMSASVSMNKRDKRGSAVDLREDISVSAPLKIHEKTIEDVIAEFQSDGVKGLSSAEAAKRLEEDGPNQLEKPPRVSLLMLFVIQLNSVIMYLLIAAVVASAAIKATGDDKDKFISYIDSIAILIIVLINATIAAVTENNANDALEGKGLSHPPPTTLRLCDYPYPH